MNDLTATTDTNTTIIVSPKKEIKIVSNKVSTEKEVKIMQIRQETWERLRNHSIYYCENLANSYDDIIIKLLDFYEEWYEYEYDNDNDNNNDDTIKI